MEDEQASGALSGVRGGGEQLLQVLKRNENWLLAVLLVQEGRNEEARQALYLKRKAREGPSKLKAGACCCGGGVVKGLAFRVAHNQKITCVDCGLAAN